jgi:hypothetical protein
VVLAVVLAAAVVGELVVVIGAAAAGESAEEDASVAAAAAAVECMLMGTKDMVSWPKDTLLVCHRHRMGAAEDGHYCIVSAGEFARVDMAAAVDNAGIGRNQVVGSSSPRETDNTRMNRVWYEVERAR